MDVLQRYPLVLSDESDSDCDEPCLGVSLSRDPGAVLQPQYTTSGEQQLRGHDGSTSEAAAVACQQQLLAEQLSQSSGHQLPSDSALQPGFQQLSVVPAGSSRARQKREAREQRARTTGAGWFHMPAPEMTDELRQELQVIQMRSALDKARVYKRSDMKTLPKHFVMGRVVEHAADFYSSRVPRKQRKRTLVEELMADAQARSKLKKQAKRVAVKAHMRSQQPRPKRKPSKRRQRGD